MLRWSGDRAPSLGEIEAVCEKALAFSSGLGPRTHVGILPFDERKNIMKSLVATELVIAKPLPFDRGKVVFLAVGRIAQEAAEQLPSDG